MAMKFVKKAANKAAKAAKEQVNELKMGAMELAEDITGITETIVGTGKGDGSKVLEFGDGPLGFQLEGTVVISVDPGAQAEALGLEAGDRLVAVAGYPVPDFAPDDVEAELRASREVNKWLKEMPRPSMLSFVGIAGPDDDDWGSDQGPAASSSTTGAAARGPRFSSPPDADADDLAFGSLEDHAGAPASGSASGSAAAADSEAMQALLRLAAEWQQQASGPEAALPAELQALQSELKREQEERRQLVAELQRAKHARGQADASLEMLKSTHQRRVTELQAQLTAARDEARKALLAASAGEADSYSALEASEARQQVLEEEVARLRQAVDAAAQAKAEADAIRVSEVEELSARAREAEARERTALERTAVVEHELRGLGFAHEAELELLRGERSDMERLRTQDVAAVERRLAAQKEQFERDLAEARREVDEARRRAEVAEEAASDAKGEAAAAAMEAASARMEASSSVHSLDELKDVSLESEASPGESHGGVRRESSDLHSLYGRIDMLEKRCSTLQKKLDARPVVFQNPQGSEMDDVELAGGSRRPSWELKLVSTFGPRAGAAVTVLYTLVDESLRRFTKKLLKHDLWLWVFYAHLVALYAIAASSYAEIAPLSDGSTIDIQLRQAPGAPPALDALTAGGGIGAGAEGGG